MPAESCSKIVLQRARCNHILLAAHGTVHLHDSSHTTEKIPQAATIPYLERNGLIACKPCGSAYAARTVSRAHCESSIGHSVSCRHLSPTLPVLCCAANRLQNTSCRQERTTGHRLSRCLTHSCLLLRPLPGAARLPFATAPFAPSQHAEYNASLPRA